MLSDEALMIEDATFQLFVDDESKPNTKNMIYSMKIRDTNNAKYDFYGYKIVKDNPNPLDIWADTSTLYVRILKDNNIIAKGIMRIEVNDFLKQMTTMKALNATSTAQRLGAISRFGQYFSKTLWTTYGSVFSVATVFNPTAPNRKKRELSAPAPEVHFFETEDKVTLKLTRFKAGTKGPVMLVHGLGVNSSIFSTDLIKTNLVEYLSAHDYDIWLLDFRVSIDLASSLDLSDGDAVAKYDFKPAIDTILRLTCKESVQAVVHCWGGTTFFMSLLQGLENVRSVVSSQVGLDVVVPTVNKIRTGLHLPSVLESLGVNSLNSYVDSTENWRDKLWDKAVSIYALSEAQGQCNSSVCHRITFNYASLYKHENLNKLLHDNLHELFEEANIKAFEHLAMMCRKEKIVNFEGEDIYTPNLDKLDMPICFIHGSENVCYLPESTERTFKRLSREFNQTEYTRHVIEGYGHIDCIFGRDAVRDVFPLIVAHLDKTN